MSAHLRGFIAPEDVSLDTLDAETLRKTVESFDFEESLFLTCLINLAVLNEEQHQLDKQVQSLSALPLKEETDLRLSWRFRNEPTTVVLTRSHTLEFIKYLAASSQTGSGHESKNLMLQCLMSAGMSAADRYDKSFDAIDKEANAEDRLRQGLPAIREMAVSGCPGWPTLHALGRSKNIFIDEMFKDEELAATFKGETGLTIEQFLTCCAGVMCLGTGGVDPATGTPSYMFRKEAFLKNPENEHVVNAFFSAFSISADEFRADYGDRNPSDFYDYKILRRRPIIRFADDRCLISDPYFFQQCAACGPVFKLAEKLKPQRAFGAFGLAFEKYTQKIFDQFFERQKLHGVAEGFLSHNRFLVPSNGDERELCDTSITYENSFVMIETKGVFLRDEVLENQNPEELWDDVRKKYGVDDKDRGIAQLANSLKAFADGAVVKDRGGEIGSKVLNASTVNFYPILLVHDPYLNAVGWIPHLLATDFARLFEQEDISKEGFFQYKGLAREIRISNLVTITIADLERFVALKSTVSFLEHIMRFSQRDSYRLYWTFDQYVLSLGRPNPQWSPLVASSQEVMRYAQKFVPDEGAN